MNRYLTRTVCHLRRFLGGLAAASVLTGAHPASGAEKPAVDVFTDVAGQTHRLPGRDECRALVLIFIAHECPISNGYAPEIARLWKEFTPRGAAFRIVYAERDLAEGDAAKHAKDFAFPCPAILDRGSRRGDHDARGGIAFARGRGALSRPDRRHLRRLRQEARAA